jgi:hypothetical protein
LNEIPQNMRVHCDLSSCVLVTKTVL